MGVQFLGSMDSARDSSRCDTTVFFRHPDCTGQCGERPQETSARVEPGAKYNFRVVAQHALEQCPRCEWRYKGRCEPYQASCRAGGPSEVAAWSESREPRRRGSGTR